MPSNQIKIGCSGWNYGDESDKGGWVYSFYPGKDTKRLRYYSQFFDTAEMDSIFYKKFYVNMSKGMFVGMSRATPKHFEFSVKVPEIITHEKRLSIGKGAMEDFQEFLEKISPLKDDKKLGAIILQLPPSFTLDEFRNTEKFLDRLTDYKDHDYAMEFRHPSWNTEGSWDMLRHYNIAGVITDSPSVERLQFLSEPIVTADHVLLRLHGRNTKGHYWYNYLYSKEELEPWVKKVNEIQDQVKNVRIYFNNHYSGKAVANALQFKEMVSDSPLPEEQRKVLAHLESYLRKDLVSS
jgi:uncharacterized protein YecE (DUF72 family)